MSKLPIVAIIGRPNTGKSTLFNRIIGQRKAIESVVPGTTRDRISHRIETNAVTGDLNRRLTYLLIDTGGIGSTRDKDFELDVARQSMLAIAQADLILFTVNSKEPVTGDDRKVVDLLRKKRKRHVPVIVVLTKADNPLSQDEVLADFQEINIGVEMLVVSAPHKLGIDELNEAIGRELNKLHLGQANRQGRETEETGESEETGENEANQQTDKPQPPRITIVGRPNVGKSSIVNALMSVGQLETSPLLVSPIAGTTRDATDTEIRFYEKTYVFVDTAGLKKRSQAREELEMYSMIRTLTSIESSDMVLLVLDALSEVTQQDKRIAALAIEKGKGLLILLNKVDGLTGAVRRKKLEDTQAILSFCRFARIIPTSAQTREGLLKIFDMIEIIAHNRARRIPTRELRNWFEQTVYGRPAGEISKTKHITQAKDIPPTFVLFVKDPKKVKTSELRFLENRMRETFGFDGVPVRWVTKKTSER